MKKLFMIMALALCFHGYSQSPEFVTIETKVKTLVANSQWDDVLMLAPDLITEEPARGEGYYYTALAFQKLNNRAQAQEYADLAMKFADESLKARIESLKKEVANQETAAGVLKNAENKGNNKYAAADWKKLWEMDKSKIEYAINAIEIYIEQKDFPAALEILNDPQVAKDAEARKISDRLNQTPMMKTINGYNKAMKDADYNFGKEYFQTAISKFDEALGFKPGDSKALEMKRKAQDELAWQTANNTNTLESYDRYLSKYPYGNHSSRAHDILQRSYLRLARDAAKARDFSEAVSYYKKYQDRYPRGPHIETINSELCELYYAEAQKSEKTKSSYSMGQALEYYGMAKKCGINRVSQSHLKSLKRKQVRWGREDMVFWGWDGDENHWFGLMAGSLNNRNLGMYVSARMSNGDGMFKDADSYWKTNDKNSLDESTDKNKKYTGESYEKGVYATIGLTKKIVHPFWICAGAGIAYHSELREFKSNSTGNKELVVNKDADYTAFNPEIGLQVNLTYITLKYSVNKPLSPKFKDQYMQHFGFAIKL